MASKQDLTIKRGTTYPITIEVTDDAGDPVDLTGATVRFTAKSAEYDTDADDSDAAISKDVTTHYDENGVEAPEEGKSTITLTDTDTYINPGNYYYDITIEYSTGVINTPVEGRLKIDGKPTNRTT